MFSATRLAALAVFVLSLLSTFTDVSARTIRRSSPTNGERPARGLGPARPRRLYSGTRTNAARAVPSGAPGTSQRGYIRFVNAATGSYSGVMSLTGFTISSVGAETYDFVEPASSSELFAIVDEGRPNFRLGAFTTDPNLVLGAGHGTAAYLKNVQGADTPAGSTAVAATATGSQSGYAQTTVFTVEPGTGKVTVQWVNSDGTVVYPSIYIYQTNVYLTCDFALFTSSIPSGGFTQVDMYLAI